MFVVSVGDREALATLGASAFCVGVSEVVATLRASAFFVSEAAPKELGVAGRSPEFPASPVPRVSVSSLPAGFDFTPAEDSTDIEPLFWAGVGVASDEVAFSGGNRSEESI